MRKTIDLTDEQVEKITEYQKRNGLKNFSEAIRNIVDKNLEPELTELTDANFALLADAILQMDNKLDILVKHTAPRHAGEVKK